MGSNMALWDSNMSISRRLRQRKISKIKRWNTVTRVDNVITIASISGIVLNILGDIAKGIISNFPNAKALFNLAVQLGFGISIVGFTASIVKDMFSIITKGGKFRTADKVFNIAAATASIALAIVGIIFPGLFLPLVLGFTIISLALQTKHLAKLIFRNISDTYEAERLSLESTFLESKIWRLENQLENTDSASTRKKLLTDLDKLQMTRHELNMETSGLKAIVALRKYKIAQSVGALLQAALFTAGISIVLTTGPVGWLLFTVGTVFIIAFSLGLAAHKKKYISENTKSLAMNTKKTTDYEPVYQRMLSRMTNGLIKDTNEMPRVNKKTEKKSNTTVIKFDEDIDRLDISAEAPGANSSAYNFHHSHARLPTLWAYYTHEQKNEWIELRNLNLTYQGI